MRRRRRRTEAGSQLQAAGEGFEKLGAELPDQAARMVFMTGGAYTGPARAFADRMGERVLAKPFDVKALRLAVGSTAAVRAVPLRAARSSPRPRAARGAPRHCALEGDVVGGWNVPAILPAAGPAGRSAIPGVAGGLVR